MSGRYPSNRYMKVFEFLVAYKTSHDGNCPSMRDICAGCEISNNSTVNYYLLKLVKDGLISFPVEKNKTRSIQIIGGAWSLKKDGSLPNGLSS